MLKNKILSAVGGNDEKIYSSDVFSTYLYTGNGSTQTINNGIDLAGKGGLVWIKKRSSSTFGNHWLQNSATGFGNQMSSNNTGAQTSYNFITSASSSGFSLPSDANVNGSSETYVSWTFRKSPRFFDVVTYTGDGTAGRQIPHSLGVAPGMVIVKSTSDVTNWCVYHVGANSGSPQTGYLKLNLTDAFVSTSTIWNNTQPTDTTFTIGSSGSINNAGATYVAYLFAHDPSADGIIQCGSFTTDASGNATVNLGWEPQWVLIKNASVSQNWFLVDTMRGFAVGDCSLLIPNTTSAELSGSTVVKLTSTGLLAASSPSSTHIYLAIRRPNKPPTTGTEVFSPAARSGNSTQIAYTGAGFAPDLLLGHIRNSVTNGFAFDRLRGANRLLYPDYPGAEEARTDTIMSFDNNGVTYGTDASGQLVNFSGNTYANWFFRRAPGFFEICCYTGTGVAQTVPHSLGVAPELMIVKCRSSNENWLVYALPQGSGKNGVLNSTLQFLSPVNTWNYSDPTATIFQVDGAGNYSAATYVAYLFASLPGISKVGSYTGNGASQTINCGFTTGARFFLVKATSTTGNWWVYDSARGIVAAADPALALNTTAAEITSADAVDPDTTGIIVNQEATCSINAAGVGYIFLAIS